MSIAEIAETEGLDGYTQEVAPRLRNDSRPDQMTLSARSRDLIEAHLSRGTSQPMTPRSSRMRFRPWAAATSKNSASPFMRIPLAS
jgi:hypothetical protein